MRKSRVLLVMPRFRRSSLLRILDDSNLELVAAETCEEAGRKLNRSPAYDLVFVDAELQPGSWKSLLEFVLQSDRTCEVIVCCRPGDTGSRAEVIQCGAYDLIVEPYERHEVLRIVRSALDSQSMKQLRCLVAAARSV